MTSFSYTLALSSVSVNEIEVEKIVWSRNNISQNKKTIF